MSSLNWQEILGWGENQIQDLRFVAYSYIKQGAYEIALTIFDALAVLTTPSFYDLQTMGALHLQMGNGLKALDFLDQALRINPDHSSTRLNRAKALYSLGYKPQALKVLVDLKEDPDENIASQAEALSLAYR